MTKLKSKKMTKSAIAILIMGIAMVAMLAFGGTYAYFTATANQITGSATTGTLKLTTSSSTITLTGNAVPGQTLFSDDVSYSSQSTAKTYVFIQFGVSFNSQTADVSMLDITVGGTGEGAWTAGTGTGSGQNGVPVGTYYKIVNGSDSATTLTFPVQIVFSSRVNENNAQEDSETTLSYMGKQIAVTIDAEAVQFESVADVAAAYAIANFTNTESHSITQA